MKRTSWFVALAALLLSCSGLAAAQCAGQEQFAGFDLLQTSGGSQDDLRSVGLTDPSNPIDGFSVTFTGVPLPPVTITGTAVPEVGTTDTIICRFNPLPMSPNGVPVTIQVVALQLRGNAIYQPNPQATPTSVTVYATINQTRNKNSQGRYAFCRHVTLPPNPPDVCSNPANVLPEPTPSPTPYPEPSSGQMTVFANTFNTDALNIQADLIIVPQGGSVNDTPIAVVAMPLDKINSSGSTWSSIAPAGYPDSTTFPSGGFFVTDPSAAHGALIPLITSRFFRGSLYGLGLLLFGIAIVKVRSGIKAGQLTLRPVYLMGLAAIAWFLGWKSSKLVFPTIAHAQGAITTCVPHTISAFVKEAGGGTVIHQIVTAVCTTIPTSTSTTTSTAIGLNTHL